MERAYDENQVAADQKYFGKELFLTGRVGSINSGLRNQPYITLLGVNPFMPPQVHFGKGDIGKIAALKKGQETSLVCQGGGVVLGIPIFKNCEFASDYANQRIIQIKRETQNFLNGEEPSSPLVINMSIAIIAIARSLPDTSTCFSDGSKCIEELKSIFDRDKSRQEMAIIAEELKLRGIQIPNLSKYQ